MRVRTYCSESKLINNSKKGSGQEISKLLNTYTRPERTHSTSLNRRGLACWHQGVCVCSQIKTCCLEVTQHLSKHHLLAQIHLPFQWNPRWRSFANYPNQKINYLWMILSQLITYRIFVRAFSYRFLLLALVAPSSSRPLGLFEWYGDDLQARSGAWDHVIQPAGWNWWHHC